MQFKPYQFVTEIVKSSAHLTGHSYDDDGDDVDGDNGYDDDNDVSDNASLSFVKLLGNKRECFILSIFFGMVICLDFCQNDSAKYGILIRDGESKSLIW